MKSDRYGGTEAPKNPISVGEEYLVSNEETGKSPLIDFYESTRNDSNILLAIGKVSGTFRGFSSYSKEYNFPFAIL